MPHQHSTHFDDFLQNEVNLNKCRIKNLMEKRDNIAEFLKQHLPEYKGIEQQGSWALKTIIKPVSDFNEYDVDLLLSLDYNSSWSAKDYISEVYTAFQRSGIYRDKISKKTRCVKLDYAEDFHLDIVPCVQLPHEAHLSICNSANNDFEPSGGNEYKEWFNQQNASTNGNLRKAVKLLKYLRDHRKKFTAKSILLTTLCGLQITPNNKFQAQTVADALLLITSEIKSFLQYPLLVPQDPSGVPIIFNPTLPGENFNRHWNKDKYDSFKDELIIIADNIYKAYREENKSESLKLWRNLFTDKFASDVSNTASIKSRKEPPKPYCNV